MLRNTTFLDFPARPPTPPKDPPSTTSGSSTILLGESSKANSYLFANVSACDTPPDNSPSSSAESDKPRKRVGFSPWTDYHKAPIFNTKVSTSESTLRPLPPSRERCSSRSILKPYNGFTPLAPVSINGIRSASISAHKYRTFAEMLESVIQQLAGQDRNSRLDSYITLEGTLKAYEGVPDPKAMASKMGLFMDFIRRDMCAITSGSKTIDTSLATHALKLLIIFLWTPLLSENLTDEFRIFVLDHSIKCLEEPRIPKALVSHHMHLLSKQDFSPKIMNVDRANRLISALDEIDDHVKGNSILGERLLIYQKLVQQARGVIIARISDWLDHLFSAMLSSIKEIRIRAIALGIDCGLALGTSSQTSRAVMDLVNRELDGGKFFELLCKRLSEMMTDKDEAMHIPQLWSVVILLLRSRRHQIVHWEHFKKWLMILQDCFNKSDTAAKFQANVAWNRLVFALDIGTDIGDGMMKVLRQPITGQLDRRGSDTYLKKARNVAFSTYCNLLYYSLRPSSSFKHLDYFWEEYVSQVLQQSLSRNQEDTNLACQVLIALLDGTQSKSWNQNRANEIAPVKPEELPRLDPRWVRSRAHVILKQLELTLNRASWKAVGKEEALTRTVWRNFMKGLAEAGNKEIKTSSELTVAIAHMFNFFRRLLISKTMALGADNAEIDSRDIFFERFEFIVRTAIEDLGGVHFTEKVLTLNSQSSFEAVATPSNRSSKDVEAPRSPVLHLIDLLLASQELLKPTNSFYTMFRDILQRCCDSRSSRRMRLELLRASAELLPESPQTDISIHSRCWQIIAELVESSIADIASESSTESSQQLGHEYREIVKILGVGMKFTSNGHSEAWVALYATFAALVKRESGDGGLILAIVEPIADMVALSSISLDNNDILFASIVLEKAVIPKTQQSLDLGNKRLWDVVPLTRKAPVFRPFNHLYDMIDSVLLNTYQDFQSLDPIHLIKFFSALRTFIRRCSPFLLVNFLKRIQERLGLWLEDSELRFKARVASSRELGQTMTDLWRETITSLESLNYEDRTLLQTLDTLIASGLNSRRRVIVTASIEYWNSTFGQQESLEYPIKVQSALTRLRSAADLQLPNFLENAGDVVADTPLISFESQDDYEATGSDSLSMSSTVHQLQAPRLSRFGTTSPASRRLAVDSAFNAQLRRPTPETNPRRTPSRKASAARLRHNDSQIIFATINSSPLDTSAMESQLMTEHQREVRDQQRAEAAAMFPDIRSSPKTKNAQSRSDLPPLTLTSDRPSTGEPVVDGPTTPTLPPSHLEGFLGSSPTPRRGNSDVLESSSPPPQVALPVDSSHGYLDIPSSPPQRTESPNSRVFPQSSLQVSRTENVQMLGNETHTGVPANRLQSPENRDRKESQVDSKPTAVEQTKDVGLNSREASEQITITCPQDADTSFQSAELPDSSRDSDILLRDPTKSSKNRVRSPSVQAMTNSDLSTDARSSPLRPSDPQDQEDEVFVDASQSPLRATEDVSEGINPRLLTHTPYDSISTANSPVQDDFSRVLDSIYDDSSEQAIPRYSPSNRLDPNEETERHLRNASQSSVPDSQTSSELRGTKRRKRASSKPPSKRGRHKMVPAEDESFISTTQEPPRGDDIYDCIVVDNSQFVAPSPSLLPSEIKGEESSSPLKGTQDPFSPPFRVIVRKTSDSHLPSPLAGEDLTTQSTTRERSASLVHDDSSASAMCMDERRDMDQSASSTASPKRRKRRKSSRLGRASTLSHVQNTSEADPTSLASNLDESASLLTTAKDTTDSHATSRNKPTNIILKSPTETTPTFSDTDQALENQLNAEISSSRSRSKYANPSQTTDTQSDHTPPNLHPPSANSDLHTQTDIAEPLSLVSTDGGNDAPNPRQVIDTLKRALGKLKQTSVAKSELRELDDVLFEIKSEAYAAARR